MDFKATVTRPLTQCHQSSKLLLQKVAGAINCNNPMSEVQFDELIREYGFRVTPQRLVIMRSIWDNGEHAEIEEVLADVSKHDPNINKATVYRTLDLFIQHGLVIASKLGERTVYEIVSDHPHHHLICRRCGWDQKLDQDVIRNLVNDVDQEYHFLVEPGHMVFVGLCAHCRTLEKSEPKSK